MKNEFPYALWFNGSMESGCGNGENAEASAAELQDWTLLMMPSRVGLL
jgi:hypothetical protein